MPLVEQELVTLPEHLSLPPVLSDVHVARTGPSCLCNVLYRWSFVPFILSLFAIVSSVIFWIDGFWLPLWSLPILLCIDISVDLGSNIYDNRD